MDPILKEIYELDKAQMEKCADHVMLGGGTRGGPVLNKGKGVRVWDAEGNEYIDCTSQSWALYLGYCNDEINQVIREHIENMTHIHQGFDNKPIVIHGQSDNIQLVISKYAQGQKIAGFLNKYGITRPGK